VNIRDAENSTKYRNQVDVKTLRGLYDVKYQLKTPLFEDEETVVMNAVYKYKPFHSIR